MIKRRSTANRFLFSLIASVLFCTIATSEIPELLTFRNDTSNDFTLRGSASAEQLHTLKTAKQCPIQVVTDTEASDEELSASTIEVTSPTDPPIFILNSVLRR
jgi:hypothetical protein